MGVLLYSNDSRIFLSLGPIIDIAREALRGAQQLLLHIQLLFVCDGYNDIHWLAGTNILHNRRDMHP